MSKDRPPAPPVPPAALFQRRIADAIAEGATAADLTLRLTLGDARRLRRDTGVPLEAISYLGGQMHFLGVKVVEGGVEASVLEQPTQA
ncbi:hypothetical protein [Caulobacter sp. RL271]|uniref:Uncharacterized protein n=1 Tax=Caulobacter segnis TaxID=88688 RepID=A0ABY4ZV11_9CAUL|nr:hypothetical protein [Caulobacter segnis]USQ96652.1 hypothetical protein MZV50_03435 [Caulobacter segnis]